MSRAELRRTEGLAASLRDNRAEVLRWKDENPLRLVAATLVDVSGRAARKDLQERIVPEIVAPEEWDSWWKVVQPGIRDYSQHFDYHARNGTRLSGTAPSDIEAVALRELSAKSRKTGGASKSTLSPSNRWITWMQSDAPLPIPRGTPPADFPEFISQQPAVLIPTAVARLREGVEERILNAGQPPKTSGVWIESLSAALSRWVETTNPPETSVAETVILAMRLSGVLEPRDSYNLIKWLLPSVSASAEASSPSPESIAEIVGMAARLCDKLGTDDSGGLIKWFVAYMSESAENVKVMANAILLNSRQMPRETGSLLQQMHDSLGGSARKALWTRLIRSDEGQVSDWLIGRWMGMMRDAEKSDMVSALLPFSSEADYISNLNSLLSGERNPSLNGDAPAHIFNPILMSWFLHRDMMPRVARVQKERIQELRQENERLRAEHRREIAEKDRLISDAKSELERAGSLEVYLRGELRKAVNIAALSFTRDAILILGETLQDLSISSLVSHQEMQDAKAGIALALLTLGAKPFGETGETVRFDSSMHKADPPPVSGTPVTVKAPGVAYFKNLDTPQAMVKMKVKVEERT